MVCNNSNIIIHVLKKQHKIQLQGTEDRELAHDYCYNSEEMNSLLPMNDRADLGYSPSILKKAVLIYCLSFHFLSFHPRLMAFTSNAVSHGVQL